MGQSRVSRHLKILTDVGFLECRRDGVWAFYFIIKTGPGRELIDSIKYLLDQELLLREDILHAEHIVQDRKLETVRFFNEIASKWDLLKKEILGVFNLNDTIIKEISECDVAVERPHRRRLNQSDELIVVAGANPLREFERVEIEVERVARCVERCAQRQFESNVVVDARRARAAWHVLGEAGRRRSRTIDTAAQRSTGIRLGCRTRVARRDGEHRRTVAGHHHPERVEQADLERW